MRGWWRDGRQAGEEGGEGGHNRRRACACWLDILNWC
jgi:hypothetical protein